MTPVQTSYSAMIDLCDQMLETSKDLNEYAVIRSRRNLLVNNLAAYNTLPGSLRNRMEETFQKTPLYLNNVQLAYFKQLHNIRRDCFLLGVGVGICTAILFSILL